MKKIIIVVIVVILIILGLSLTFSNDFQDNRTTLNVSSEGPIPLSKIIHEIKSKDCYAGYDNQTVEWMESLGNKSVWFSSDEIVIMDKSDSDKIPSMYVCDAYFQELFSCNVLENHSLGSSNNSKNVLLVKNVEYIGEETHYFDV